MEIVDEQTNTTIGRVLIGLTASEAAELRDSLDALLSSPLGRHEHVPSADYQGEITVWITDSGP